MLLCLPRVLPNPLREPPRLCSLTISGPTRARPQHYRSITSTDEASAQPCHYTTKHLNLLEHSADSAEALLLAQPLLADLLRRILLHAPHCMFMGVHVLSLMVLALIPHPPVASNRREQLALTLASVLGMPSCLSLRLHTVGGGELALISASALLMPMSACLASMLLTRNELLLAHECPASK